ncbi:MAG TPA: peptide-methionine (R)-S-oxide reductase MsrB [Burkholderiales bacterium]|nr:peptide-methionine (R)-S-oxide reductase MsrB [Burkholderiales bacterium]
MQRRSLLAALAALPLAALAQRVAAALPKTLEGVRALQAEWRSLLAAGTPVPAPGDKLVLSDAEWKKRLTPAQYGVLRREGTERAYTSPLDKEKRAGVFVCAGCGLPLFTSAMKFDSGTGWPSFFTTIPGAFGTKKDSELIFMVRTEYHCIRCGGHHGHVFEDGPPPTRLRYCNNGVALNFIPKD